MRPNASSPPFRAKLQNHMRADVCGPNVVFGVDEHHVRCDEQVVSNAAKEFARRIESHKRMFSAVENVDMSFGVHRNASRFDEMLPRRH